MLRVGIVGAESNHSESFSVAINVEKRIRGVRVTHIWGEKTSQARQRAVAGEIPRVVKHPEDMIGEIDGVVIAPCHPKDHLPAGGPFWKPEYLFSSTKRSAIASQRAGASWLGPRN